MTCDGREFVLDTREMKEMLGDVPLHSPEVSAFIMDYLKEKSQGSKRREKFVTERSEKEMEEEYEISGRVTGN